MKAGITFLGIILIIIPLTFSDIFADGERGLRVILTDKPKNKVFYKESHALIIGATNYTQGWPSFPNIENEINKIKEILSKIGFDVEVLMDPTKSQMVSYISDFADHFGQEIDSRIFLYFIGHGYSHKNFFSQKTGFFVPVDAPKPNKDLDGFIKKAFSLNELESITSGIKAKHILYLFNSSFTNANMSSTPFSQNEITLETNQASRQIIIADTNSLLVGKKHGLGEMFVNALKGMGDFNKDGKITGSELAKYFRDSIKEYSNENWDIQFGNFQSLENAKGDFVFSKISSELSEDKSIHSYENSEKDENTDDFKTETSIDEKKRIAEEERRIKEIKEKLKLSSLEPQKKIPFVTQSTPPEGMVFVLGSEYLAGSEKTGSDSVPLRKVFIQSFYIDKTEVTQEKYKKIMGRNPSRFKGENLPVERVSWSKARKYCQKIGKRLPTEAEWEYAARGGAGNNSLGDYWFNGNTQHSQPVGKKEPNSIGLYDMLGNVWEWTQDWYDKNYYETRLDNNPLGPKKGTKKVLRGGAWNSSLDMIHPSYRSYYDPRYKSATFGFRCAKSLKNNQ